MRKKEKNHLLGKPVRKPDRIVMIYVLCSSIWIFSSGYIVAAFAKDASNQTTLEIIKGLAFIVVTAIILQLLISRYISTIQKQVQRLNEANRDLNTFIYKASHDLRGPITSTLGLARLASEEIDSEEARWYFEKIYETNGKLDNLLHNLISFISIRSNNISVEKINLNRILGEVIHKIDFDDKIKDSNIYFHLHAINNFYTDSAILSVSLQNIIENALQYTQDIDRKPEINIRSNSDSSNNLILEIEDNGMGIPASILPNVFHMLYRGNAMSRGSGLGLYISKSLLEKIGGDIKIESEVGVKTTVKLVIPSLDL